MRNSEARSLAESSGLSRRGYAGYARERRFFGSLADPGSIPGASTNKSAQTPTFSQARGDFCGDAGRSNELNLEQLRRDNRRRRRALITLKEIDPEGAAVGLAVTKALDAAYRLGAGDDSAADEIAATLEEEARRHG